MVMENTHQFIKRIENTLDFTTMLQKGIIPISILDKKVYYEYYLNDFAKTKLKIQSVCNTSEEFNVSERTIQRAIQYMEN